MKRVIVTEADLLVTKISMEIPELYESSFIYDNILLTDGAK